MRVRSVKAQLLANFIPLMLGISVICIAVDVPAAPATKVLESDDKFIFMDKHSIFHYLHKTDGKTTTFSRRPLSNGKYKSKVAIDSDSQNIWVAYNFDMEVLQTPYQVYKAPINAFNSFPIKDLLQLIPVTQYERTIDRLSRLKALDWLPVKNKVKIDHFSGYSYEDLIRNTYNWDITAIDDNQLVLSQQSIDQSSVTIWLYTKDEKSPTALSTKDLKPMSPPLKNTGSSSQWYRYATCSLKSKGDYSVIYANKKLWLLNDNWIAPLQPDLTHDRADIDTASRSAEDFNSFAKLYLGTPKDLNWTSVSDSKVSNVVLVNRGKNEFRILDSKGDLIIGDLSGESPKFFKENSDSTSSLLLKSIEQKLNHGN